MPKHLYTIISDTAQAEPTKHKLQEILERNGVEGVQSYSGRGMYGKTCLGVSVDSLGAFFATVLKCVRGEDDTQAIQKAFAGMATDSMGRGVVVYFPSVHFEEEGGPA